MTKIATVMQDCLGSLELLIHSHILQDQDTNFTIDSHGHALIPQQHVLSSSSAQFDQISIKAIYTVGYQNVDFGTWTACIQRN